jgi:hypothetical protein
MASINYPIGMNLGGIPVGTGARQSGRQTVALSAVDLGRA